MTMPASYTLLGAGRVRVLVRDDAVVRLGAWLVAPQVSMPAGARSIATGRGGAFRAEVAGLRVVVRPCRRGGWLGRVIERTYLGWRPRPFAELAAAATARARGAPTPAVVAARVEGWGVYRGAVVTEEVADARTLADVLRGGIDGDAQARLARSAGRAVGRLHAAGVDHADLNLDNLLVSPEDGASVTDVLDLDKARVHAAALGEAGRRRNLARLARSWRKLTREPEVPAALRQAFGAGYEETGGSPCAC